MLASLLFSLLLFSPPQEPAPDPEALIELAEVRRDASLLDAAERALSGRPKDPQSQVTQARLAFIRSEFVRAAGRARDADRLLDAGIDAVAKALDRKPDADGYALLADMLGRKIGLGGVFTAIRHSGRMEDAMRRAQDLGPSDVDVLLAVGRNFYHAPAGYGGSPEKAIDAFRRAAELAPQRAIARFWLGRALERAGNRADAAAHYRKALELESRYVQARTGLERLSK